LIEPPTNPLPLPARAATGGIILHVRVTPRSSEDAVLDVEMRDGDPVLKVKVRAIADKGEANDAVVAVLAKWLRVPKAQLKVAGGAKSRVKQIFVSGEPAGLMTRLAERMSGEKG
jgi:uncharacterized protein YggU (UPF0235/DUF167 family)